MSETISPLRDKSGKIVGASKIARDITDRKRSELRLRQSEEFHRQVIENANAVPFRLRFGPSLGTGVYEYVGRGIETLVGVPPERFSEQTYNAMIEEVKITRPGIPRDPVECRRQMLEGSLTNYSVDVRIRNARGETKWLSDTSLPFADEKSGKITGAIGVLIDITERRQAEEALRQAEEKYRTIYEQALEGMYRTSPEGKSLGANPAMARILGYSSPEEVMAAISDSGNQVWKDPGQRLEYVRQLEEKGVIRGFECEFLRHDGTPIWVSLSSRRVSGADGSTLYYEGFIEDVTERKQAQNALQESEERFRTLSDKSLFGVYLIQDGKLAYVNDGLARIFGLGPEELTGIDPLSVIYPEDREYVANEMRDRLAGVPPKDRYEVRGLRKDGEIRLLELVGTR
ncbi:MAG TPA: PAS domain S-box protein, partial [Terriglobia bacterium]|nr:PAS domain S-box protein [Terriglobia bacterium]